MSEEICAKLLTVPMPKGDNPNSRANLVKGKPFNEERARIAAQKSVEKRRKLRTFRELDEDFTSDKERLDMLEALKAKAKRGNVKAFEVYRDTMGMNPKESGGQIQYEDDGFTDAIKRSAKDVWK